MMSILNAYEKIINQVNIYDTWIVNEKMRD